MHWVGGALLDPKAVHTERHWFVRYMAIIIGHFEIRGPTRGAKCERTVVALRQYFRTCTGAKFSTRTEYHSPKWATKFSISKYEYSILYFSTVRLFIDQGSFWATHCHQKRVRTEISGSGFLDVNRYIVVHPIGLRRVFFALREYFDTHF
jgi:hypothetical protein